VTAPVFDVTAARTNTPHWPPLDGDIWTDNTDTRWAAYINDLGNETAALGFLALDSDRRILPAYLLEIAGPLRLVTPGWQRNRQAVAA
jgi:hypothetical protein